MTITLSEVTAWAAAGESDTVDLKRITGERRAATQSTLSAATKAGLPRVRVEVLPVVVQVAEEPEGGGLAPRPALHVGQPLCGTSNTSTEVFGATTVKDPVPRKYVSADGPAMKMRKLNTPSGSHRVIVSSGLLTTSLMRRPVAGHEYPN